MLNDLRLQRYRLSILSLIFTLFILLLSGCGGRDAEPTARPTPTAIPRMQAPTAVPTPLPEVKLLDAELLGAPNIVAVCDHPPEAQLECQNETTRPHLAVEIDPSTYARWSLRWPGAEQPLTGNETLVLAARRSGNLTPNLYLVERSGRRLPVNLGHYGLADGASTVHMPLREIKDEEGRPLNYSDIGEIQVVFEWAEMSGELAIESVRFASVWREPVSLSPASTELAAGLKMPAGFRAEAVADNVQSNTQIQFTRAGDMLVSLQEGRVWWYADTDGDGVYDQRHLYDSGYTEIVGLLYDPVDGAVWIGGRGQLVHSVDSDGNGAADTRTVRLEGLPWGRHQNNGLAWNPDPDPFTGEPGHSWLYFGLGATGDLEIGEELNATILRFPRDGQGLEELEIVSRGVRNAYDLTWASLPVDLSAEGDAENGERAWQLFASENGPDFNDAPDEVIHVRWQHHYGFPEQFGMVGENGDADAVEGDPYSSPVYPVAAHASADGIAYVGNSSWPKAYRTLYVALFGEVFSPTRVGHTVERIELTQVTTLSGEITYRGEPSDFVVGLDRPLPLTVGPEGNLVVGDYATGVIYRIVYVGEE